MKKKNILDENDKKQKEENEEKEKREQEEKESILYTRKKILINNTNYFI